MRWWNTTNIATMATFIATTMAMAIAKTMAMAVTLPTNKHVVNHTYVGTNRDFRHKIKLAHDI